MWNSDNLVIFFLFTFVFGERTRETFLSYCDSEFISGNSEDKIVLFNKFLFHVGYNVIPSFVSSETVWDGRIRTSEWRDQNPLPYRLATPHFYFYYTLINTIIDIGYSSIPTQIHKNIWDILLLGFNTCRYRIIKFIDHYMEFN